MIIVSLCISCSTFKQVKFISNEILVTHLKESTIAITSYDKEENENYISCSGVWVDEDVILTAYHCISKDFGKKEEDLIGEFVKFVTYKDIGSSDKINVEPRIAEILAVKPSSDLALLSITYIGTNIEHEYVKIYKNKILAGKQVSIIGNPLGLGYTYMNGYVSSERQMKGPHKHNMKLIQISAPVIGGVSGGGAFDFNTGELLGICSFSAGKGTNLSFFIHKDTIIEFLFENNLY